jgi:hypothetical protein
LRAQIASRPRLQSRPVRQSRLARPLATHPDIAKKLLIDQLRKQIAYPAAAPLLKTGAPYVAAARATKLG